LSDNPHRQLLRLSLLVQLEQRARDADADVLPYAMVNETYNLTPYRQAAFYEDGRIAAVSGLAAPDAHGPFALYLVRLMRVMAESGRAAGPFGESDMPSDLAAEWRDWLPPCGFWAPLSARGEKAALAFFREEPWSESEQHLLGYLLDAYAHALSLARAPRPKPSLARRLRRRPARNLAAALCAAALFLPIRESVLAEAEVIPRAPSLVRAPLDGVVERFHVRPNQATAPGQPLLSLDPTQLRGKLKVALEARDIAQAEYQQASQQALFDVEAKARLATLKSKLEQQVAEAEYVESLLKRCDIAAERAGVAVFDDPDDWLGKPVTQGEKILVIADPQDVELEVSLPMGDLLPLQLGGEILFFPNAAPDRPVAAQLDFIGYNAQLTPAETMAYRLKAAFAADADKPRLGFRGVAKLYGERRPFILWALRKPLNVLRQWLGV
jgi:hypothetical protein